MPLSASELVCGIANIEFGGVDLGLTEGPISLELSDGGDAVFSGAQSLVIIDHRRGEAVEAKIKAKFNQITFRKWGLLQDVATVPEDGASSMDLAFNPKRVQRALVLTMPGSNDSTRVATFTATCKVTGSMEFGKGVYTGIEAEFTLIGNPSTNSYGTITETESSSSVPAVQSWQKLVASTPTTIVDGESNVEATAAIQATFNVDIRPDMLTGGKFLIIEAAGNAPVGASVAYGSTAGATDRKKIVITPTSALSAATTYKVMAIQGVYSFDRLPSASSVAIDFTIAS